MDADGVLMRLGEVTFFVRELRQQIHDMGEAESCHQSAQHRDCIAVLWCARGHRVVAAIAIIAHGQYITIFKYNYLVGPAGFRVDPARSGRTPAARRRMLRLWPTRSGSRHCPCPS